MSRRFENAALAILIAGIFFACVAIAYQVGEQDERYYASRPRADQELAASPAAPLKHRRPAADRSVCRNSETEKEYELCQAWRSADAARESADTAWLQLFASIGGLIGLIFTVVYTARAAAGASKSANAALETLRLERRGHLAVDKFTFSRATWDTPDERNVQGFFIDIAMKNMGKAPAITAHPILVTRPVAPPQDTVGIDWRDGQGPQKMSIHIGPDQTTGGGRLIINVLSARLIYEERLRVLYMVRTRYCDLFDPNVVYHTDQCFELKVAADPTVLFANNTLSLSQYLRMEGNSDYSTAS